MGKVTNTDIDRWFDQVSKKQKAYCYIGGSLLMNGWFFEVDGFRRTLSSGEEIPLTDNQLFFTAKLYLENKTEKCAFYEKALKIVNKEE